MATRASNPTRTLLIFVIVIAVMYIAVAALGNWKPKLGLDLQGGTRITLQAKSTSGSVTADKLSQAVDIINNRVNGAGISEAEVTTQGSDIVTVSIPGKVANNLAETIGSTAQLRFRIVAASYPPTTPPSSNPTTTPTTPTGSGTATSPTNAPPPSSPGSTGSSTGPALSPGTTAPNKNRPGFSALALGAKPKPAATTSPKTPASTTTATTQGATPSPPTTPPTTAPSGPSYTVGPPAALQPPNLLNIPDPWAWVKNPPSNLQQEAASYVCPARGVKVKKQLDVPSQPLIACDSAGVRYLLGPAVVEGTAVSSASSGIQQGQVQYSVTLSFNGAGTKAFGDATTKTSINQRGPNAGEQMAIVLDSQVLSAPTNNDPILGGQAIITGSSTNPFTQSSAASLANSLKYGALPLSFQVQDQTTEGPELASGQLNAGIVAGIAGLILVVLYCMFYYRGLSFVVISSLAIAGLITYALVLLLGHAYGFTLTLPGIAGLIVAVGITADSFIVYFERLRDEVRDGKTLRTSVETGWARARMTILAADSVSMLAALVLFIFAIGDVKGFAFALGLTTLVDVFVVFFFTKPVVTLLARTKFFGHGHKLSGLDRQHLGMPPLKRTPRTVRGEA